MWVWCDSAADRAAMGGLRAPRDMEEPAGELNRFGGIHEQYVVSLRDHDQRTAPLVGEVAHLRPGPPHARRTADEQPAQAAEEVVGQIFVHRDAPTGDFGTALPVWRRLAPVRSVGGLSGGESVARATALGSSSGGVPSK